MIGARARFEAALADGRIELPFCTLCLRHAYPPGLPAPGCCHDPADYEARAIDGSGVVYALTTVNRRPEQGGDCGIVLVDLAEGVRVMAAYAPGSLAIGDAVRLVSDPAVEGPRLLAQATMSAER